MAEEDTPQEEKTEEPTARRLEKAKEEGIEMPISTKKRGSLKALALMATPCPN